VKNITNDFREDSFGNGATGGVVLSLGGPFESPPEAEVPFGRINFHIGEYIDLGGAGGVSKLRSLTYPEGKNTETSITLLTTAATVAYAPTEWLGIGASFHFIYGQLKAKSLIGGGTASLNGSPQINGVGLPGNPTYTDFIKLFQTSTIGDPATYVETDTMTSYQVSGSVGVSVRPLSNLGFGISYTPMSLVLQEFMGNAQVDATRTVALAIGPLAPQLQNVFLATLPDGGSRGYLSNFKITVKGVRTPENARASFVFWPIERVLVGGEVAWFDWVRALQPVAILAKGDNRDLNFMIGSNSVTTKVVVRWQNEWVYSLYTSVGVTDDLTLRLGFNYGGMPVNKNTLGNGPNSALVSTTLTAGAGYRIGDFEIDGLFESSFYASVKSDGSTGSASSNDARYSARQFLAHLGVSYEF
jgi:long-subunit fatty acid transport protein